MFKNYFGLRGLSLKQQILYKKMYDAFVRYDEFVICGEKEFTEKELYRVLRAVVSENPSFFYVNPEKLDIEQTNWGLVKIWPCYVFQKNEIESIKSAILKSTKMLLEDAIADGMDSGEIIKSIHDTLISYIEIHTIVDNSRIEDVSIYGPIVEKRSSCLGLALTFKYLLNEVGIDCQIVFGEAIISSDYIFDAWNIVKLYDEDRHLDVFADAMKSGGGQIAYDYFGVSTDMICRDHWITNGERKKNIKIEPTKENNERTVEKTVSVNKELCEILDDPSDLQNIENGIIMLEKIPRVYLTDELELKLNTQLEYLKQVCELKKQYSKELEEFDEYIMKYLPDQLEIIKDYCRYKKCSASPIVMELVHERLIDLIETFSIGMKRKLELFWKDVAGEMLLQIGGIQQDLGKEKAKKKPFPFDVSELDKQTDIDVFIKAYVFLEGYELPPAFVEQICLIEDGLKRMKKALDKYEKERENIYQFLNYYLPESIKLIIQYDDYLVSGVRQDTLQDIDRKIMISLKCVKNAINCKVEEIYKYDTMSTKARAEALTEILLQDGYASTNKL